jgi:hypothetical protein
MESLLMSIALRYGKGKLTDIGLNYAAKLLGIDQQQQNPKYTYGMPFTNQSINPINMLKKSALNTGVKSLISSGAVAPLTLGAGAIYFLNKNRKKLTGYDTQQAYEDAVERRRADKRLDKITDRIVDGKNYGNYEEALLDSGAGAVDIDGTIYSGPDYQGETSSYKDTEPESVENITRTDIPDRGRGQDNVGSSPSKSSPSKSSPSKSSSYSSSRGSNFGGRFHFAKGGIASL